VQSPVRAIDIHAAHRDDPVRDTPYGVDDRARIAFGHRAHIHDRDWIERPEGVAMIRDARAIAVDVAHGGGKFDLVLAAVEDCDVMPARHELPNDAWADEHCSSDDEDATHRGDSLPPVVPALRES
jgi:hypothetical protein